MILLAQALASCGGANGPAAGEERGPCYGNGTCSAGLTCLSDFCVQVPNDGGADASPPDDTAGTADTASGPDDGASSDGAAPVGPHPMLPQVSNIGGAVLAAPRVQPIYFSGDTDVTNIQAFLAALPGSSYWRATTAEYGVGALSVLPPIVDAQMVPPMVTDDLLRQTLDTNTTGARVWGAADPGTIYLFVIPQGALVTFMAGTEAGTCCNDFGGYHSETIADGLTVPYAVGCACPNALGKTVTPFDERTIVISHELIEASTDPFPYLNPAFQSTDRPDLVWSIVTGGEVADMCALNPDAYMLLPGTPYMVQRSWSNAAARVAANPCVPRVASGPYFNIFPALSPIVYDTNDATYGIQIALGSSQTIPLTLFSSAPTGKEWTISAYTFEDLRGGDVSSLGVSLDKTTGHEGDTLHLTLSPRKQDPSLLGEAFILSSQIGRAGDPDYQVNLSMGLVTN